jgi:PAS domain S-box-containing protein
MYNDDFFKELYLKAPIPYQSLDAEGNFLAVNEAWCETLGYEESEVVGRNAVEFLTSKSLKTLAVKFPEFIKSGFMHGNIYEIIKKDGSVAITEFSGRVSYDKEGNFIRTHCIFKDITKQIETENELAEMSQRFSLFMENFPHVVTIKDENYKNIYTNGKEFDYIGHSGIGKTALQNLGIENADKLIPLCQKAKQFGTAEDVIRLNTKTKAEVITRVTAFKIPQTNGKVYTGLIYNDITQSYKDKERLKEQEEMLVVQSRHAAMGEMISMIAHQWRQPLSVISMGANNILIDIELENLKTEELIRNCEIILRQTQELSSTIDDFRDFFKPKSSVDTTTPKELFTNLFKIIDKSLENNNISVEINHQNQDREIQTYSRELVQILLNIVLNAKDALLQTKERERKIRITTLFSGEKFEILICDNAGGIADEYIENVFDAYFTTKEKKNGTGIGLYMSKSIVEKHLRGSITCYNDNEGACFSIKIPLKI